MSAPFANPEDILAKYADRIAAVATTHEGMEILAEVSTDFGRRAAQAIVLKVGSEPGWTAESAETLIDQWVYAYLIETADLVKANGGTVEMAQAMTSAGLTAFGLRLREMTTSLGPGGTA